MLTEDLDDFAYIASHDLKEPLRGLHTHARFLLEEDVLWRLTLPDAIQREVIDLGALLEYPIANLEPVGATSLEEFVERIRAAGPEHVVLSTDLGQAANRIPPVGFADGVQRLLDAGFTEREMDLMIRRNPARVLNIDP